jgi:uncharacterized membrane-anchored protein
MKKSFVILAVILQIIVLVYMAGEREIILRQGKIIHLRTAPIDPRDVFRGDYVRLNYDISRIPLAAIKDTEGLEELKKGQKIYVSLKEGSNGLYEMTGADLRRPKDGLFLTGRSVYPHRLSSVTNPLWINYGIEAYFVEQGRGRDIEKQQGNRTGIQIPLEMEIAVSSEGEAVIRGFRWSPLGIGLQVLRNPQNNQQNDAPPRSATVQLTLTNATNNPIAIVNLPDYCSFLLEPVPWAKKQWVPAHDPCVDIFPSDFDVLKLAPKQQRRFVFDFSTDRWLVEADDKIQQIGSLEFTEQFRLVYRPPDEAATEHLRQKDIIWHGYLPSRVFHGRGQVD